MYGDEIGNVFFTQPFDEKPSKVKSHGLKIAQLAASKQTGGSRANGWQACAQRGGVSARVRWAKRVSLEALSGGWVQKRRLRLW